MNKKIETAGAKPRMALAIATGLGVGYAPVAPGTFGSLMGLAITWLFLTVCSQAPDLSAQMEAAGAIALIIAVSVKGVWAANRVAAYLQKKDPQIVVVDEISGQMIAYLGLAIPFTLLFTWKALVSGFVLFRIFDIWKPFPIRRLEALPGGWGIMADDW